MEEGDEDQSCWQCADGYRFVGCGQTTGSRPANGVGQGAAAGGVIGSLTGDFGAGAAIGAGALGGYLYDQHQKGNID